MHESECLKMISGFVVSRVFPLTSCPVYSVFI